MRIDPEPAKTWMKKRGWTPQEFQLQTWEALANGYEGLVNAPTGSGKTYSILLPFLLAFADQKKIIPGIKLIWITPIRALAKEIQTSAMRVLDEEKIALQVAIRTGDTSTEERQKQKRKAPDILITTPESLHLMLCSKDYPVQFSGLEIVVADEWHELLGSKRGVMLELALSRLRSLSHQLLIWGISATIGNLTEAMQVLHGYHNTQKNILIRSGIEKKIEVIPLLPEKAESLPWAGHLGIRMSHALIPIIQQSSSTLIFTNVRSQCEIWYRKLLETDESLAGVMAMHHSSISREIRNWVEDALYEGRLKAVVCTSSLDLGVDFAPVESIIQIGGPKGISRFMQRAGRSGHRPDAPSRIYFLPTHSLELIEAAALRQAVREHLIESKEPVVMCFDVLIQYLVTLSIGEGFDEEEIKQEVMLTHCFHQMSEAEWKWVMRFITLGGETLSSYDDYNKVKLIDGRYKVSSQRIARRHRLSIGTIVSDTMMTIKLQRGGTLGHIEESFIAQFNEGDNFWFAGMNLELVRIHELTATVRKSTKPGGRSPVWLGGKLPLSSRMSDLLRRKINEAAASISSEVSDEPEIQFIQPILRLQEERSHVPALHEFLIEMFRSEDGYHAVFYPFEGRFVHEGLAALFALRISRLYPISFSMAYNDYGFELLSDQPIHIEDALGSGLIDPNQLEQDVLSGINASEMARRRFRDIAAIAGLVFKGYPGQPIKDRHLQSSSQLIFKVFEDYDPGNLLLRQSYDEVVHYQLEMNRLRESMQRINQQTIIIRHPEKPSPFAFPIMVDRLRERMSSENLSARIAKMTADWAED